MTLNSSHEALRAAVTLYERDLYDEALDLVQRALADDPDHGRLWELQGLIHRARREAKPALHALETASLLVPLQAVARCALAECYAHAGRRGLARDLYRSLLFAPDVPAELLLPIAAGLDHVGDPLSALKACREASRRDPDAAQPYYEMGYYLGRCGYPQHLIEAVARKAIEMDPDRVSYRVGLVSFLHRNGRSAEAYHVVRGLTLEQIGEISCRCCLDRVVEIFEQAGDWPRAELCREQLTRLAVQSEPSDRH